MPIYEFEAEDGARVEQFFHVSEAPRLGAWVEFGGRAWRRVIEAPQIPSSKGQQNYRLHSEACPNLASIEHAERKARYLREKGHPVRMPVRAPSYDEVGRAVFKSPKELQDYCAKDGRFAVGDTREIAHKHASAVHEKRVEQVAGIKARERAASLPQVS